MRMLFALLFVTLLAGCATPKVLQPIDGSRSDGKVVFSYEYGGFEIPKPDLAKAEADARARCSRWGYNEVEAFAPTTTCVQNQCSLFGCNCVRQRVDIKYQCY